MGYPNRFRYLDGDMPKAFVNTRMKWGRSLNPELAGKWRLLWKWWIGLLLGLFGCIFLALISAILGLLAILADAIGLLVVGIVKLVYLYRTAKRFREYQPAALQKEVL